MQSFIFNIPTKIIFGTGSIAKLTDEIPEMVKSILIVTDKNLNKNTQIIKKIETQLTKFNVSIFDDIAENPLIESVDEGAAFGQKNNVDFILGIGGGSSMDAAKGIALSMANQTGFNSILNGEVPKNPALPFICIPTTSGTGSEVTPFAVFTDQKDESKKGFAHQSIFPKSAIVDPELTYSMPENVRINTGLDVLAHASEAFFSTDSNALNDQIALEAIKLVIKNLLSAVEGNKSAMENMAYASILAGVAITHASTILPHIMGYPLTVYHKIPHGKASILCLPALLDFLMNTEVRKKAEILNKIFEKQDGLRSFLNKLRISDKLSDQGILASELDLFVEKTICKGDVKITPGNIDRKKIKEIYLASM